MNSRSDEELNDPQYVDPVIEAYKKDIDRTLIRENLRRTVQERVDALVGLMRSIEELNRAGRAAKAERARRSA